MDDRFQNTQSLSLRRYPGQGKSTTIQAPLFSGTTFVGYIRYDTEKRPSLPGTNADVDIFCLEPYAKHLVV